MNYETLTKVNKRLRSIEVKGKNYVEVNERIKAFRELFPNGSIETNIEKNENNIVVMSCTIKDEEGKILSKAHAYEKENSTFINKTSYIENCCTSATGRALGYLGIGIDTSIASAEEVQNAMQQQKDVKLITKSSLNVLQKLIKTLPEAKAFYDNVLRKYNIKDLSQLTVKQHGEILIEIKKLKGE